MKIILILALIVIFAILLTRGNKCPYRECAFYKKGYCKNKKVHKFEENCRNFESTYY